MTTRTARMFRVHGRASATGFRRRAPTFLRGVAEALVVVAFIFAIGFSVLMILSAPDGPEREIAAAPGRAHREASESARRANFAAPTPSQTRVEAARNEAPESGARVAAPAPREGGR